MIELLNKQPDGSFVDENGTTWDCELDYLLTGVLGFCGCGSPEDVGEYVRAMLLRHVKQTDSENFSCWERTSYEDMPTMFFLYWADDNGYIEHGSTIRCSWMTPKGDSLLRDLSALCASSQQQQQQQSSPPQPASSTQQ